MKNGGLSTRPKVALWRDLTSFDVYNQYNCFNHFKLKLAAHFWMISSITGWGSLQKSGFVDTSWRFSDMNVEHISSILAAI